MYAGLMMARYPDVNPINAGTKFCLRGYQLPKPGPTRVVGAEGVSAVKRPLLVESGRSLEAREH